MMSNGMGRPTGEHRPPEEVDSPDHHSPEETLSSFFQVLAASFAHARDRSGTPSSRGASKNRPEPGDRPRPARRLWPRPIILIAAACVVLAWIAPLVLVDAEVRVPDALVGNWKSPAPKYGDGGFTITKTSLAIKSGPKGTYVPVHPIIRVRIAGSGESMVYTIDYLMENAAWEFSFRLWPGPPPVIRSVNQPEVAWQKEDVKFSPSLQALHYR